MITEVTSRRRSTHASATCAKLAPIAPGDLPQFSEHPLASSVIDRREREGRAPAVSPAGQVAGGQGAPDNDAESEPVAHRDDLMLSHTTQHHGIAGFSI